MNLTELADAIEAADQRAKKAGPSYLYRWRDVDTIKDLSYEYRTAIVAALRWGERARSLLDRQRNGTECRYGPCSCGRCELLAAYPDAAVKEPKR